MTLILLIIILCVTNFVSLLLLIRHDGVLEIDISNQDKENYCFKIDDLDKLKKKKRITLKVGVKK